MTFVFYNTRKQVDYVVFILNDMDKEKISLGYKFKVISNMVDFSPTYFKDRSSAESYRDELSERWKLINVYVLIVDLEAN